MIWRSRFGLGGALVLVLLSTVMALPAAADVIGQAPPALTWMEVKDSRGVSAWNYEISIDRGGMVDAVTNPSVFLWSAVVDFGWTIYWGVTVTTIWFLDWVLSFSWVKVIADPVSAIAVSLQSTIDTLGLVPTLLTAAAVMSVLWMARGKWATGIWELAMALVIAALATGVFAQPVQLVAGPDGLLYGARDAGFELAAVLSTEPADDPQAVRNALTGSMVDTFIRQPAEIINFGQVVDGGKCEDAYTKVVKDGPYGLEDTIREEMAGCDDTLGEYAAKPSAAMAMGALVFMPAAAVILLLGVVIAGSVLLAGVSVLWQALKAIVQLVAGLLPGGTRGSLLLTFSEAVMSLLLLTFSTIFLAVFMLMIRTMFGQADGNQIQTFVITDIVLLLGVITYLKSRRRIRDAAGRLAGFLAQRPGSGPTRLPAAVQSGLSSTAAKGVAAASTLLYLRGRRPGAGSSPAARPLPLAAGPVSTTRTAFSGVGSRPSDPAPGGEAASGPVLPPSPSLGGAPRAGRAAAGALAGAGVRLGAQAALAYVTGGSSTLVAGAVAAGRARRAAQLMSSGRRLALAGRLALPPGGRPQVAPPVLPVGKSRPQLSAGRTLPAAGRRPQAALPAGATGQPAGQQQPTAAGRPAAPLVTQQPKRTPTPKRSSRGAAEASTSATTPVPAASRTPNPSRNARPAPSTGRVAPEVPGKPPVPAAVSGGSPTPAPDRRKGRRRPPNADPAENRTGRAVGRPVRRPDSRHRRAS